MSNIHLICGKICSGKSYYAKTLAAERNAVILSVDEITYAFFNNDLGDKHEEMTAKIREYLSNKAVEIAKCGLDVILDWGFWSRETRAAATVFFSSRGISVIWHYIDISDEDWMKNIEKRNDLVTKGLSHDYYLDEGLYDKLMSRFEVPERSEIDVWYENIVK